MQRRLASSWSGIGAVLLVVLPSPATAGTPPSFVSADAAIGIRIKPTYAAVTGECSGKIADSDRQTISVLVEGTAQSEGPAAATGIACIIYQDADGDGTREAVGDCSATMPLNVAACAEVEPGLPFEPFVVCAVATTYLLNGDNETSYGENCPGAA